MRLQLTPRNQKNSASDDDFLLTKSNAHSSRRMSRSLDDITQVLRKCPASGIGGSSRVPDHVKYQRQLSLTRKKHQNSLAMEGMSKHWSITEEVENCEDLDYQTSHLDLKKDHDRPKSQEFLPTKTRIRRATESQPEPTKPPNAS